MNWWQRSRRGFSLIEILVVITILTILIALLLPALDKAQVLSQSTGCLSNLRQLGTAFNEYLTTYQNQFLPYADVPPDVSIWTTQVVGFLGDNPTPPSSGTTYYPSAAQLKVFQCPSTVPFLSKPFPISPYLDYSKTSNKIAVTGTGVSKYPNGSNPDTAVTPWLFYTGSPDDLAVGLPNVYAGSYGFNEYNSSFTHQPPWNTNNNPTTNPTGNEVTYAGNSYATDGGLYGYDVTGYFNVNNNMSPGPLTPLFGDCGWYDAWPNTSGDYSSAGTYTLKSTGCMMSTNGSYTSFDNHLDRFVINRHNMAINMVFRDGHADNIPLAELWQLQWSADYMSRQVTIISN